MDTSRKLVQKKIMKKEEIIRRITVLKLCKHTCKDNRDNSETQ